MMERARWRSELRLPNPRVWYVVERDLDVRSRKARELHDADGRWKRTQLAHHGLVGTGRGCARVAPLGRAARAHAFAPAFRRDHACAGVAALLAAARLARAARSPALAALSS